MSPIITTNKIKSSLDAEREIIQKNPAKWKAEKRGNRAPIVSTNKTQPAEYPMTTEKIVGSDLSKMVTTENLDPKPRISKEKTATKKRTSGRKAPARTGKKKKNSSEQTEAEKKIEAPARSESVADKKKT